MSQSTSEPKVKKRKQAAAAPDGVAGPSTKKPRKEKVTPAAGTSASAAEAPPISETSAMAAAPTVQDRRSKKDKAKGKSRAADGVEEGEFTVVRSSVVVSIPPVFADNPRAGVEEMLDSMLMRYVPALQGVVLTHSNLEFPRATASIIAECPYSVSRVEFDAMTWSPRVGMKLTGKVNLSSPDHVSLLVHRTFNVSIPRHHIPTDNWEFEYGPAANDPEFGADAADGDEAQPEAGEGEAVVDGGRWVHKLTGERLGEPDGILQFTVVGITVANQMLSLIGSIQSDPFSPDHVPDTSRRTDHPPPHTHDLEQPSGPPAAHIVDEEGEGVEDDEDEELEASDEVTERLAEERRAAEEAEREERRRAEEKAAKRAKKEKRKAKEEGRGDGKKRKK